MKAIFTKFVPATDTRAAKIKAWAEGVKPLTVTIWHDGLPRFLAGLILLRRCRLAMLTAPPVSTMASRFTDPFFVWTVMDATATFDLRVGRFASNK